jgi:flagellar biogenesis protein FliO
MTDALPGLLDALRALAALALVLGLIVLTGWFLRRHAAHRGAGALAVEDRLALARGVQLVVVNAHGRRLLMGVSEKSVQLLTDLEIDEDVVAAVDGRVTAPAAPKPAPTGAIPAAAIAGRPADFTSWLAAKIASRRRA